MKNDEVITERKPPCVPLGSALPAFSRRIDSDATHEDNGGVQDTVAALYIIAVKLFRFAEEEVGARVIGLQRNEEFFEDRPEAVVQSYCRHSTVTERDARASLDRAGLLRGLGSLLGVAGEFEPSLVTIGWECSIW